LGTIHERTAPQIAFSDRRDDVRRAVIPGQPLWVFCKTAAVGGQATLFDVCRGGAGIAVEGGFARRLVRALRSAMDAEEPLELSCIPLDWSARGRVTWIDEGAHDRIRVGIEVLEEDPRHSPWLRS